MELQELYALMERFAASGLSELEWQREGERVCLRRPCAPAAQAAPVQAAAPAPAPAPAPAAPAAAPVANGETIAAPMPGNILRIEVTAGQAVKAGQILLILEAMKMENEIVAPRDGTVAQIVTSKGATVETGAPLVILA